MQATPVKPRRVLVIDDSDIAREVVGSILTEGGWTYYDVSSPLGATSLIAKLEIDILVVDMNMPVMSGSAFAQLVRNNPRFAHIKLVLITGDSLEQLTKMGEKTSADAVLMKADLEKELLPTLERISARTRPTTTKGTAMVVDHDPGERARCVAVLEALGYEVTQRAQGRGTLADVVMQRPELVLLAADLPDLPGAAVVELIRENRGTDGVQVVLRGDGSPLELERIGDACGASAVLRKGVSGEELRYQLERVAMARA